MHIEKCRENQIRTAQFEREVHSQVNTGRMLGLGCQKLFFIFIFFETLSSDMRQMLDGIFERAGGNRQQKIEQKKLLTDRISHTENQLMLVTREMKMKIHNMVEEVEQKVSKALNEEIWRLGVLVDEFNLPFHTEPLVLNVYKKEINAHVETGLGSNLRARLSTALAMNVETAQREMTDRMHALIPSERVAIQQKQNLLTRTQPFEMFYTLNCQNLCADFQENLEFRFSWGITAMIQRFTGRSKGKLTAKALTMNQHNSMSAKVMSPTCMEPSSPMCLIPQTSVTAGITPEQLSMISRFAMASIGSQGTVGGLLIGGLVRF